MDTALTQKLPFILDRNLAKANCPEGRVCTSCDKVVFGIRLISNYSFDVIKILAIFNHGISFENLPFQMNKR